MGKLFEEDAGVPVVWTFDGTTVKKRPKKNVDKELREGRTRFAPAVFRTEVQARRACLEQRQRELEAAKARVVAADRLVTEAMRRLQKAEDHNER